MMQHVRCEHPGSPWSQADERTLRSEARQVSAGAGANEDAGANQDAGANPSDSSVAPCRDRSRSPQLGPHRRGATQRDVSIVHRRVDRLIDALRAAAQAFLDAT